MNNIFYDYYQKAQNDPKWFLYTANASETKIIDPEELDNALTVMGEAKFKQEFECSFTGHHSRFLQEPPFVPQEELPLTSLSPEGDKSSSKERPLILL